MNKVRYIFTETCLHHSIADQAVALDRQTMFRSQQSTGLQLSRYDMSMAANEDALAGTTSRFLSIFVFSIVIFFGLTADAQMTSKNSIGEETAVLD